LFSDRSPKDGNLGDREFVLIASEPTNPGRGDVMRKILTALVAAGAIGAMTMAMSSPANAWRGGWGGGWGWGLGGFAVGALVGSALAAPYYYPYGNYGYSNYGYSNYGYANYYGYAPRPYYGPGYNGCQRAWNGWAWVSACY
jgi:hypothetical protein